MKKIFFLALTALVMYKCGERQVEETKNTASEGTNELISRPSKSQF